VPVVAQLLNELIGILGRAAFLDVLGVVLEAGLQLGKALTVLVDRAGKLGRGIL